MPAFNGYLTFLQLDYQPCYFSSSRNFDAPENQTHEWHHVKSRDVSAWYARWSIKVYDTEIMVHLSLSRRDREIRYIVAEICINVDREYSADLGKCREASAYSNVRPISIYAYTMLGCTSSTLSISRWYFTKKARDEPKGVCHSFYVGCNDARRKIRRLGDVYPNPPLKRSKNHPYLWHRRSGPSLPWPNLRHIDGYR